MTSHSAIPPQTKRNTGGKTASRFRVRLRHRMLLISFIACVVAPLLAAALYLWGISQDQYASEAGFTVREEDAASGADLLGGFLQFSGGALSSESDILYEYIRSREIVEQVNKSIDLRGHYSSHYPTDWFFSVPAEGVIEDLAEFWQQMVNVDFDQATGLISLRVTALDPETAKRITEQIVALSAEKVNALNEQARQDALRFSDQDLELALERLKTAREALIRFQTSTLILNPEVDFQSRMGVLNNLQQQLAAAMTEYDLLIGSSAETDPRLMQAQRRIEVIRSRIEQERASLANAAAAGNADNDDFPKLFAEYEGLIVDREYAETVYRSALAANDAAKANFLRNSRYLATYIRPTLAESSEYPQRGLLWGVGALFLLLSWSTAVLIYYSIRDRG